jgi:tetratricopeptide (TPR) repeat protein
MDPDDLNILEALLDKENVKHVVRDSQGKECEISVTLEDIAWARKVNAIAEKAFAAYQRGDYAEAIRLYREALKLAPGCDLYLMSIGSCYGGMGRPREGLPYLERAAEISPNNVRIKDNLAKLRGMLFSGKADEIIIPKGYTLFRCVNERCTRAKRGKAGFVLSDKPKYAKLLCLDCREPMEWQPLDPDNIIILDTGERSKNVNIAGFLPVVEEISEKEGKLYISKVRLLLADPDIEKYPSLSEVQVDPNKVHPTLLSKLQTCMAVLVRKNGTPRTAIIVRAASHELQRPLSSSIKLGLHIECQKIRGHDVYAIYPLIYDIPSNPFFKETWLFPYDVVGGPEDLLSSMGWRKLFYLLTQDSVDIIVVNEADKVVLTRCVEYPQDKKVEFLALSKKLPSYCGKQLDHLECFRIIKSYLRDVDIQDVKRRF